MTTAYTPILKLALPVTGELSGTWGTVVNDNITSMVEQAVAGLATINTWTTNAHTLTTADGTTSEARCAMLVAADGAGGTALTGVGEIICPAASKLYVLKNGSSYAITLKTSGGTGVAVPAGDTAFLFCDGTNVNACVTTVVNGHISGNLTVDGNTTLGDANTDTVTVNAQFNTDLLPSTDNARDLGSTAKSWRTLYCDTSVLAPLVTATNLQVTNIKANDGTAAMSIADSTGAITVSTILNVDNLRLDGNTLSSTDSNGNVVLAPNGTGDVQLDADTVRIGDSNANATLTTNGTGDLILNTNSGTNSGSITIEDGVNGNIIIAPNGTGQVQITNAALDLTTIEVSNINAKDGTAAITIADSTGAVGIATAVTMSATTQNIALGTSQTSGTFTVGGAAQTGTQTFDQSTKTHTLNLGTGATESGQTKTINIGTGGVATSTTAIAIGSTNGTTITLNGTVNATTVNVTTLDLTNLEVTNIKAKDGTAAMSIADSTGAVTVSSAFAANGGVTIGDASGDAFTINSSAVSTPNGLNFDSNTFVIDATNNRVGINNASPTVELDVTGALTISGNAILGDASTDTVRVNGYMGVGGAGASTVGVNVVSAALSGATQYGIAATPVGTGTTQINGIAAAAGTSNTAFTVANASGFRAINLAKGAASTITNYHGVYVEDLTQGTNNYGITSIVSSGTDKWNIYASGTAANYFAGNLAIGSTTQHEVVSLSNTSGARISFEDQGTRRYTIGNSGTSFTLTDASASADRLTFATDAVVFNDPGNDYDFRVESDTNTHAFFVQGSDGSVFIGASGALNNSYTTPKVEVVAPSSSEVCFAFESATNTQNVGLYFAHQTTSGSPQTRNGSRIIDVPTGAYTSGTGSTYSAALTFWTSNANTVAERLRITAAGNVGIGTDAPTNLLSVAGNANITGNVTLGDASTDTVTVNGYMGVGGAANSTIGIYAQHSALTGSTQTGFYSAPTGTSSATSRVVGFSSQPKTADAVFTASDVIGFYAQTGTKGASSTVTNWYGIQIADQTQGTNNYGVTSLVSSGSNKWNIYASGTAANYFAGKALVGTTTDQDGRLIVRSTGNNYANSAVAIVDSANTTKLQMLQTTSGFFYMTVNGTDDFVLKPTESVFNESGADIDFRVESDTNTHALFLEGSSGNVGIGTSAPGAKLDIKQSGANWYDGLRIVRSTNDNQRLALGNTSGASYIASIDAAGGTNNALLFGRSTDGTTFSESARFTSGGVFQVSSGGSVQVGGTAARATTAGTNRLDIFDGTAPVGTLANGISIYSSSGEAYVMDAAGNATLFSPHDRETNEWIFKSKHTPTGKVLKIDVEKLLRFVNNHFGLDAIQEFIEE